MFTPLDEWKDHRSVCLDVVCMSEGHLAFKISHCFVREIRKGMDCVERNRAIMFGFSAAGMLQCVENVLRCCGVRPALQASVSASALILPTPCSDIFDSHA